MTAQPPLSSYNKTIEFRRSTPGHREFDLQHKFMQTIGEEMFAILEKFADEKGIRVQTLLRAVIIPEWLHREKLSLDSRWNPTRLRR
jgi:hypothetical protein